MEIKVEYVIKTEENDSLVFQGIPTLSPPLSLARERARHCNYQLPMLFSHSRTGSIAEMDLL